MPDRVVERIWVHARAVLRGEAARRSSEEVELDHAVLDVLGVGREAANRVLFRPDLTLADFERWIEDQNGGSVAPWRLARAREITGPAGRDPEVQRRIDAIDAAPPALSDDDLDFFEEHGYVVLHEAVGADLRDALADAVPRHLDGRTQGIMVQLFDHPAQRAIRELPRIHKAFAQLWGTADLIATTDRCGFHPPERDGVPFAGPHLHLDLRSLEPPIPFGLGGLIYLTDTPAEQGAFQCVPGFHHRIDREPPATRDLSGMEGQPIPGAAGDMVIWHHALPHGATPNRGERPRIVQYLKLYPPPLGSSPAPAAAPGPPPARATD
jgi:ectoine hydroxylase-related dioxygenase (phytanoyl-CoA dioxygenase family)